MSTKIKVWKQGSFLPNLGHKTISFDHHINPGPSDNRVIIAGFNTQPGEDGHYVSDSYSADDNDAIHTFGISRYLLELYEQAINRKIPWTWETEAGSMPLTIYIRNCGISARYMKEAKCIQLDYYGPYENWTYYCRSTDIIAHETGHAILDSLKPLWEKSDTETRGMVEAFCDLAAMFFITTQYDLCQEVIKETNGDLKKDNILSQFGVGYGPEMTAESPIRSAINQSTYSKKHQFTYDFGEVLVGSLYDLLCEMVKQKTQNKSVTATDLFQVAHDWQLSIIKTFDACNEQRSSLSEFAQLLIKFLPAKEPLIKRLFKERQVVD